MLSSEDDKIRFPLHLSTAPNDPPFLDLDKVSLLSRSTPFFEEFQSLRRFVSDPSVYAHLLSVPPRRVADASRALTTTDIEKILLSDKFDLILSDSALRLVQQFSVTELGKQRRRLIGAPTQLNDELKETVGVPNIDLIDPVTMATQLQPHMFARCADLEKGFRQIPLASEIRPFFAFPITHPSIPPNVCGVYTSLPMGVNFAPALMHSVLKILAYNDDPDVLTHCYIDNVRFAGKPENVNKAFAKFLSNCKFVNSTVNSEKENALHQQGVFLGLETNYQTAEVKIAAKTLEKIKLWTDGLADPLLQLDHVVALVSSLFYASRALRLPLAEFYPVIKFYRRRMSMLAKGQISLSSPAVIWPSVRPTLSRWISLVMLNSPTRHPPHDFSLDLVLFTDASTTGWGGLLFDEKRGTFHTAAGSWGSTQEARDINFLEARALALSIDAFYSKLSSRNVQSLLIVIDNTALKHTLTSGSAHSFKLNEEIRKILPRLPKVNVRVSYIASASNPADPLSRGKKVQEQLASVLGGLGGRLVQSSSKVNIPVFLSPISPVCFPN